MANPSDKPPRRKGAHTPPQRITEPEHPWDRLPDEGEKAYAAFLAYRDLGPGNRSLDAVGASSYPSVRKRDATGRLQIWSSRYRWVARAAAYDEAQAEARRQAEIEQHRKDLEEASHRKRQLRAESWADFQALNQAVRDLTSQIALERDRPKAVRELCLARDRLIGLAREAFQGLEATGPDLDADGLPPDVAAEILAVLAKHALRSTLGNS